MQTQIELTRRHQHHSKRNNFETIDVPTRKEEPETNKHQVTEIKPNGPVTLDNEFTEDIRPKVQQKANKDVSSSVIQDIHQQNQQIKSKLNNILNHYKEIDDNEFLFSARSPAKQQKIKQFLTNIRQQKKQRRRRLQSMSIEIRRDDNEEEKVLNQKKKIIQMKFQKRMKELEENQEMRQKQHEQFKQFYREFKKSKPVYLKLQEQAEQKMKEEERERFARLQNIAKKYQPMTEEQFAEHVSKYQEALREFEMKKRQERQKFQDKIQEMNEKLESLWKGRHHARIQREQMERKMAKEQPKQKNIRRKEYGQELREQFPKTVRKPQKSEVSPVSNKRKRYRYFKGEFYGQIEEDKPKELTEAEKRALGNNYLEIVKQLPKKRQVSVSQQTQQLDTVEIVQKKQAVPKQVRNYNPLYSAANKINLSLQPSREQVAFALHQVKDFDRQVSQQQKVLRYERLPSVFDYQERQQKINNKLVRGIEEKLNLLAQL